MEVSNYIKMRDQMQERFLTYDQKEIEGKYGFAFDDDYSMCVLLRSGE